VRVHSLNCGTMLPRVVGRLVCHVLLCEADDGLVLVDTGIGTQDLAAPGRLGPARWALQLRPDPARTALAQVQALGFAAQDVRHVVLTHLDLDHAGGLADFPHALVHTTAAEHAAAVTDRALRDAARYRPPQWSHGPRWQTYAGAGERWQGLAAQGLEGLGPEIALVPMPGHSLGHAAVAVDTGQGWLLHAGDAAFDRSSVDPTQPRNRALLAFEQLVAHDRAQVATNHARLVELHARGDVRVVTAHDPELLAREQARTGR